MTNYLKTSLSISILLFGTLITLNYFFKTYLQEQSIYFTLLIFKMPFSFSPLFYIFSYPFYYNIDIIVFLLLFLRRNKKEAFSGFCMIAMDRFIQSFLKVVFHDTRPCFENLEISAKICSCSFGMPSGHSCLCTLFYFYIYYSMIYKKNYFSKKLKTIIFCFYIFLILGIAFSRIALGAHFFNQVIAGLILGFIEICIYLLLDKSQILNIILNTKEEDFLDQRDLRLLKQTNLLIGNENGDNTQLCFKDRQDLKKKYCNIIITLIFFLTFITLGIGIFVILTFESNPYHPFSKRYCDSKCFNRENFLVFDALISTYIYSLLIFFFQFLKNREDKAFYYNEYYYSESFISLKFVFYRSLLFFTVLFPIIFTIIFSKLESNFVIVTVLIILGNIAFTLLFTIFLPWAFKKYKLFVKGDFFVGL